VYRVKFRGVVCKTQVVVVAVETHIGAADLSRFQSLNPTCDLMDSFCLHVIHAVSLLKRYSMPTGIVLFHGDKG
jgi:hypothetical protein